MSHEFMEVHEVWRLGVDAYVQYPTPHDSIWVPLSLNPEICDIVKELDATIFRMSATIIFKDKEDITVFRLRTGV